MTHQVIPLCGKIQKNLGISVPSPESPLLLGSRVQTLNRQLQELLAWTKFEGQNRVPQLFPGSFANPSLPDTMSSARSTGSMGGVGGGISRLPLAVLHQYDDALLSILREEESNSNNSNNVAGIVDAASRRLNHVLSTQCGVNVDILPVGAMEAGLASFPEKGQVEIDWIASLPAYYHQSGATTVPLTSDQRNSYQQLLKQLEEILDLENTSELALKHLKACFKDFVNLVNGFADNIQNSSQDSQGLWGPAYLNRSLKLLRHEAESLILAGEDLSAVASQWKMHRLRSHPLLAQALSKVEETNDILEKTDKERCTTVKKLCKTWEKSMRDAGGFNQIRSLTTKTRFYQVRCTMNLPGLRSVVSSSILVDTSVPLQTTRWIEFYVKLDRSGKVKAFLDLIRLYVRSHRICDPSAGFLSPFAWMVLAFHLLFRCDLLPNLHDEIYAKDDEHAVERFLASILDPTGSANVLGGVRNEPKVLPKEYQERLAGITLIELLDRFFRYYVEVLDIFQSVITLRGQGEVRKKSECACKASPVLWRLCIEDPFESEYQSGGYDLGQSLSRSGQLTVRRQLSYITCGISYLMTIFVLCNTDVQSLAKRCLWSLCNGDAK